MELIKNPLAEAEFWDFMVRTVGLLGLGLVVMTLTQITNLRAMVRSLGFKKYCSWLVILPAIHLIVYAGRIPFLLFVVFLLWAASKETLQMLRIRPFFRKIFILNQLVTVVAMVFFPDNIHLLPAFYLLSTFTAAGLRNRMYEIVKQVAFSIIGSLWIGYFLALLVLIRNGEHGETLMIVILGLVVLSDVFAFLCGGMSRKLKLGTSPLASNISPNKVMAGVFGNILGALICILTFALGLGLPWYVLALLVVLSGIGAAYGDLAESIIKRHAGVKDASTLIPFHGGMMDRIDSLLFVVPIFYLVLSISWVRGGP